jgi:hypothetical protein
MHLFRLDIFRQIVFTYRLDVVYGVILAVQSIIKETNNK